MVYREVQHFCMRGRHEPILVAESTYIGCHHDQYRSRHEAIQVSPPTNIGSSPLSIEMDFNLREVGHKESPEVV